MAPGPGLGLDRVSSARGLPWSFSGPAPSLAGSPRPRLSGDSLPSAGLDMFWFWGFGAELEEGRAGGSIWLWCEAVFDYGVLHAVTAMGSLSFCSLGEAQAEDTCRKHAGHPCCSGERAQLQAKANLASEARTGRGFLPPPTES